MIQSVVLCDPLKQRIACRGALGEDTVVTVAGLCNTYASYVATYEEYQAQRYEGASTIFGPHTLDAYLQTFRTLATALRSGAPVAPGPDPPNLLDDQVSFLPEVVVDEAPFGTSLGAVVSGCDAGPSYGPGACTPDYILFSLSLPACLEASIALDAAHHGPRTHRVAQRGLLGAAGNVTRTCQLHGV